MWKLISGIWEISNPFLYSKDLEWASFVDPQLISRPQIQVLATQLYDVLESSWRVKFPEEG